MRMTDVDDGDREFWWVMLFFGNSRRLILSSERRISHG